MVTEQLQSALNSPVLFDCAKGYKGAVALRGVGAAEIVNRGWSDHQGQLVEGSQDP
jgi:hypothetical protein